MKKTIIVAVSLFFVQQSYAQPGSGYARRAIEDKYEKDNAGNKQKGMDWMNNAMNGKTEDSYKFPINVKMHVTTYKGGEKKDENDMDYYLNTGAKYFGMKMTDNGKRKKSGDMFVIYDFDNNSSIMINEDDKTYMAINLNAFMSAEAQANRGKTTTDGKYKNDCKKSGKSKTIQGYSCEEYECIDEDRNRRSEIWVTTKIPVDISQSFTRSPYAYVSTNKMTGMMMEGSFFKNDQIESKMEVTTVNQSANYNVTMSNYSKQGMR